MGIVLFIGAAALAVVLGYRIWLQYAHKLPSGTENLPASFRRVPPLSDLEQSLFQRLIEALPDHVILPHVPVSHILVVDSSVDAAHRWNKKLSTEILDYLVCRSDFSVVGAIKLENPAGFTAALRLADEQLGAILHSAGIKLVKFPSNNLPPVAVLRHTFH